MEDVACVETSVVPNICIAVNTLVLLDLSLGPSNGLWNISDQDVKLLSVVQLLS